VATFSTVLSNIANEWCALATDAASSNTIKTAGSKWKILILGSALSGLRFAFILYSFLLVGSVVLKIGSRDWPGSSGNSVVPRTSLNPSSPGSFDVVVPLLKQSLLLVSHSQRWTRWPAASSSFARRNA